MDVLKSTLTFFSFLAVVLVDNILYDCKKKFLHYSKFLISSTRVACVRILFADLGYLLISVRFARSLVNELRVDICTCWNIMTLSLLHFPRVFLKFSSHTYENIIGTKKKKKVSTHGLCCFW